jgi:phage FluMu protein gp41
MPILWFVVSTVTDTAISTTHGLFETDLLKGIPIAEKISLELTLWGSVVSAVLILLLVIGVSLFGRFVRKMAQAAGPVSESYERIVTRWDLMRVPADQGLMLTAMTAAGVVLSVLFWVALPVSTPHPHDCCKKPEAKIQPPYKPLDALNKDERIIAQLAAQVEAIEKQKAEEEAKDKGKAGKAKPAGKVADKGSVAGKP